MRVVEVNLNLRVERGFTNTDYTIDREVAEKLCGIIPEPDVIVMVEYMECENKDFLYCFMENGYKLFTVIDDKHRRGIMIAVKDGIEAIKVSEKTNPHMLHLNLKTEETNSELIGMRILVGGRCDEREFEVRKKQFLDVYSYIKKLDRSKMIITGDFNNARILDNYRGKVQRGYNYQWIVKQFAGLSLNLVPIEGYSHKGYLKEDHIVVSKNLDVCNVKYDYDIFDDRSEIGYPDHVPIIADIEHI